MFVLNRPLLNKLFVVKRREKRPVKFEMIAVSIVFDEIFAIFERSLDFLDCVALAKQAFDVARRKFWTRFGLSEVTRGHGRKVGCFEKRLT